MKIVFIGPPGAGKGTQAVRVASHFWLKHLSTGDLLREARDAGEPIGLKVAKYLDDGRLVPDEIVIELVARVLEEDHDAAGHLFDGFPRTRAQAIALDKLLDEVLMPLTAALEFVVPEEELYTRLFKRKREDDSEETIRKRMQDYAALTKPLVEYYEEKGILRRIDAVGTPDEVFQRLRRAIQELSGGESPMAH